MNRRAFITLLGGATAWPLAARAQQPDRMRRIGYLVATTPSFHNPYGEAFLEGLRDLGYVEGKNVQIERRFANGDNGRLFDLAAELVDLNVDVMVSYATGVSAARRATSTIPIVMVTYGDALASGIVASLSHPGGNITGSTFFSPELMAKRLELMKEFLPSLSQAGVLLIRDTIANGPTLEAMGATANALQVGLQPFEMRAPTELEGAFSGWAEKQIGAVVVGDHGILILNASAIVPLAARHRIPLIGSLEFAPAGSLMSYGVNFFDLFRRAALFVDKILKGAKAGDIPVERPTKFTTIVNMKSARALGIETPTSILLRADEVIE